MDSWHTQDGDLSSYNRSCQYFEGILNSSKDRQDSFASLSHATVGFCKTWPSIKQASAWGHPQSLRNAVGTTVSPWLQLTAALLTQALPHCYCLEAATLATLAILTLGLGALGDWEARLS